MRPWVKKCLKTRIWSPYKNENDMVSSKTDRFQIWRVFKLDDLTSRKGV